MRRTTIFDPMAHLDCEDQAALLNDAKATGDPDVVRNVEKMIADKNNAKEGSDRE